MKNRDSLQSGLEGKLEALLYSLGARTYVNYFDKLIILIQKFREKDPTQSVYKFAELLEEILPSLG